MTVEDIEPVHPPGPNPSQAVVSHLVGPEHSVLVVGDAAPDLPAALADQGCIVDVVVPEDVDASRFGDKARSVVVHDFRDDLAVAVAAESYEVVVLAGALAISADPAALIAAASALATDGEVVVVHHGGSLTEQEDAAFRGLDIAPGGRDDLRRSVLTLRDQVIGAEAELGTARRELEKTKRSLADTEAALLRARRWPVRWIGRVMRPVVNVLRRWWHEAS